jgi:hypothetical protein
VIDSAGARDSRSLTVDVRASDADRVFDWAEATYPEHFPKPGTAGVHPPYIYRYYAATGVYLGTAGGRVVVHNGREWILVDVGALADFLKKAEADGF